MRSSTGSPKSVGFGIPGVVTSLVIPSRFNGPPQSANGGYACGCVADFVRSPPQIRLRSPPPLDQPIEVRVPDKGDREVSAAFGTTTIATGRPGSIEWTAPDAPSTTQARDGRHRFRGLEEHFFPTCFVCGPARTDGLRLFPGPIDGRDLVACDWSPDPEFVRENRIDSKILWAALDCPSFFGTGYAFDSLYLLGQMTADVPVDVPGDRAYIVYGWSRGRKGRKHLAASALADDSGQVWARAEHIWIKVERP